MGPESPTMLSIVPSPSKRMSTIMTDKNTAPVLLPTMEQKLLSQVSPTTNGRTEGLLPIIDVESAFLVHNVRQVWNY